MAWTYCRKCDTEMEEPTLREVLTYDYLCPNCGSLVDPQKSVNECIIELLERVEALENENGIHP